MTLDGLREVMALTEPQLKAAAAWAAEHDWIKWIANRIELKPPASTWRRKRSNFPGDGSFALPGESSPAPLMDWGRLPTVEHQANEERCAIDLVRPAGVPGERLAVHPVVHPAGPVRIELGHR